MDWDNITQTGARAPGVERRPLARRCSQARRPLTQSRETRWRQRARRTMANRWVGKSSSDIPALKLYWGKPALRNFREGNGNVGIIRSPVRAIVLPDRIAGRRRNPATGRFRRFAESGLRLVFVLTARALHAGDSG